MRLQLATSLQQGGTVRSYSNSGCKNLRRNVGVRWSSSPGNTRLIHESLVHGTGALELDSPSVHEINPKLHLPQALSKDSLSEGSRSVQGSVKLCEDSGIRYTGPLRPVEMRHQCFSKCPSTKAETLNQLLLVISMAASSCQVKVYSCTYAAVSLTGRTSASCSKEIKKSLSD